MLCYNSYSSPNIDGFSPYELTFGHKMAINPDLEVQLDIVFSGTFHTYYEKLKKAYSIFASDCKDFEVRELISLIEIRNTMLIKLGKSYIYIYMYQAKGTIMHTVSKTIACYYVRPLVIYKAVDPNQFLLMSLDGVVYPYFVKETRLKPGAVWTTKGNVYSLTQFRQFLSTRGRIAAQGS